MSKLHEKSKFIEYLRETPLVNLACKKVGISRATYYRWFKDDREFREDIQKVIRQGRANINDLAEATLIKMIKGENFHAIRFWLQHNNRRYVPVRTTYIEPPDHNHTKLKPGETCTYCGTTTPSLVGSSSGYYEREIAENKIKFEKEAKKRKKLSARERSKMIQKYKNKVAGIRFYQELAVAFPNDESIKLELEAIKNGTREFHGVQGKAISTKADKERAKKGILNEEKDDDGVEDVLEI